MPRQYRGCSRLYYAPYEINKETGKIDFGTPVKLCEVKNISREISSDNEEVWADNKLQDTTYGGTSVTRTFGCMRIDPAIEAILLGKSTHTVGGKTFYGTAPDGSSRPYVAIGYALHDGDVNNPCEVVWGFKAMVNSISQTSNTIDRGTGSEGQELNVTFSAPDEVWSATGKSELDIALAVTSEDKELVEKWFKAVVTYDNVATTLGLTGSGS